MWCVGREGESWRVMESHAPVNHTVNTHLEQEQSNIGQNISPFTPSKSPPPSPPLAWSLPVSGTNNCVTQPDLDWVLVTVTTLHHHHLSHIPHEKLISHISDQTCNFVSGREKALCSVLYCVLCTVYCDTQQRLLSLSADAVSESGLAQHTQPVPASTATEIPAVIS